MIATFSRTGRILILATIASFSACTLNPVPAERPFTPVRVSPTETSRGVLVVRGHKDEQPHGFFPGRYRSYTIYDDSGNQVDRWTSEATGGDEAVALEPGNYYVVATIQEGMAAYGQSSARFVIVAGRETCVDLENAGGRSASPDDGSP